MRISMDNKLYEKFPGVLREKLQNKDIDFPDGTLFEYEPILTYRAVERKKEDCSEISILDFKSYYELGKTPKQPRGKTIDFSKDPQLYGVSSFLKKEIVEQKMKFPNPKKKMAVGYVYCEGGPEHTKLEKQHVCWWLYEDADVSGFKIIEV